MVTVDSLYVKEVIDKKFVARENRVLATLLCRVRVWKRVQTLGDWEEDVLKAKMSSLRRERTPCEQALRIRWTGAVNFPRSDPTLHEQTALREAVTNAIAQVAGRRGSAKYKKSYLDPQEDAMIETQIVFGTQTGKGPCETEDPLHCTAQSTTKDETKTSNFWMQRSDTIGSTITSERSTTARPELRFWQRVDETREDGESGTSARTH